MSVSYSGGGGVSFTVAKDWRTARKGLGNSTKRVRETALGRTSQFFSKINSTILTDKSPNLVYKGKSAKFLKRL